MNKLEENLEAKWEILKECQQTPKTCKISRRWFSVDSSPKRKGKFYKSNQELMVHLKCWKEFVKMPTKLICLKIMVFHTSSMFAIYPYTLKKMKIKTQGRVFLNQGDWHRSV